MCFPCMSLHICSLCYTSLDGEISSHAQMTSPNVHGVLSKPQKVVDKPSWHAPHQTGLFPVSIEWEPPFTMLVDLVGHGDHQVLSYPRQ